jgi:hypothetical protein
MGIKLTPAYWVVVPARQANQAGRPERQPYAGVNYVPHSGTMNLGTDMHCLGLCSLQHSFDLRYSYAVHYI